MSVWANIAKASAYDTSAPWYMDPATGQPKQAKANADGEYILPTQENGEPVMRIPDSDPRVKQSLISTYGYDPTYSTEDFRYGQGGETTQILNRDTGQYETAVMNPQTGNRMPMSVAQAQGIPFQGLGGYQSGGGFFSDIMGGLGEIGKVVGPLAAVAGGANFLGGLGAAGAGATGASSGMGALAAEDAMLGQAFNSLSPGVSAATGAVGSFGGTSGGGATGGYSLPDYGVSGLTSLPSYYSGAAPAAGAAASGGSGGINGLLSNILPAGVSANSLIGPAISGIGSIIGGISQGNAAESAAQRMAEANNAATGLQSQIYQDQKAAYEPWRQAGVGALNQLTQGTRPGGDLMRSFGMSDYQADPGYGFRLSEGMKALERSAAARGNLLSGGALKGITRYGQDMASNEYQNAYNRYNTNQSNQFNRLSSMAGLGQTANTALGNAGSSYANNVGQMGINSASAQANADLAGGASRMSGYLGAANAIGNALSPNPLNQWLTKALQGG